MALREALKAAARGWKIFPVWEMMENGRCACPNGSIPHETEEGRWKCEDPGKHPRVPEGHNEATGDASVITLWWTRWPRANLAVATGRVSGITIVDADVGTPEEPKPGEVNLSQLCTPHGGLPSTLSTRTGGGGIHLIFQYNEGLRNGTNILAEAVDVRNDGGYAILPPSNHYLGGTYTWRSPEDRELLPVPAYMLEPPRTQRSRPRGPGRPRVNAGFPLARLTSLLTCVDPDDRDRWLAVGVIMGRQYIGSPLENDAWNLYETWAGRSSLFDTDRTGNIARMREMFYDRSQEAPRAGGQPLSIASIIKWAREGGWTPFGGRSTVEYEPGFEVGMAEELNRHLLDLPGNRFFSVLDRIKDVVRAKMPKIQYLNAVEDSHHEMLIVRETSVSCLLAAWAKNSVLETADAHGAPKAHPIPPLIASMALESLAHMFPPLTGIAEWPMIGRGGEIIAREAGYDPSTGVYFEIPRSLRIVEMDPVRAWREIRGELFMDFPFEDELHAAAALGMAIAFMQRPLMRTCPGFAVTAPQPGSGKSTLVDLCSLIVHGVAAASHSWSNDPEELRKGLHSLILHKYPAVLFDNLKRGSAIDSDHLAKMLTSETSVDRTLGASITRRELNRLLITFTGNNISFIRDMSSRVLTIKLNARTSNPLLRSYQHTDVRRWAVGNRSRWLSAVIAIARLREGPELDGSSRFIDFDEHIARPIFLATGIDIRSLLNTDTEEDAEDAERLGGMIQTLWMWQEALRGEARNHTPWRSSEVVEAIESRTFPDEALRVLQRGCDPRTWERDKSRALGYALRSLRGNYRFLPMVLDSTMDEITHVNQWIIRGGRPIGSGSGAF